MSVNFKKIFRLKTPCKNCPFLKDDAAIELQEGRLSSIKADLLADDNSNFYCHKTTYSTGGGDNDDGDYEASGQESVCMGSMAFLLANGRASIPMRLAFITGLLSVQDVRDVIPLIKSGIDEE